MYNRPLYEEHFSRSQIIGFQVVSIIHLNLQEEDNLSTEDTIAEFILSLIHPLFRFYCKATSLGD